MYPNCHFGRLGAVATAAALVLGLGGCDRGGESTVRSPTTTSGADTTATGPSSTAASAAISGSGISTGTPTTTTITTTPGAMVGTSPPGAVAPYKAASQ
jgi:hypothetical protein